MNKRLQPAMGHRFAVSEQGGEQMPMPVRCNARKGGSRSEVLQDALGRSSKQQEPPRNLHRKAMEQKGEREQREKLRNRFGSTSSSPREILSSSPASSFYRSRRSRSALNAYLPYPTLFDPPRYLIRP